MMRANGPIRVGLVGLGRAGWGMHCEELIGKEDKFSIVAACDIIPERCARMAERYACATYATIEELVADPQVEVVDIATRSHDHFAHAKLALEAGKHVFLEKPMCVNYDEACALQALDAVSQGTLYIRHNRRFEPAFQHVREIMDSGLLGNIFEIKLRRGGYQRRDDWQTIKAFGGGQLLNWGPHVIDQGLRLLGAPVQSMWSQLQLVAAVGDAEDQLKILLTGENGRLVDLEICGGAALTEPECLVWGSKGSLRSTGEDITLKYLDPSVPLQPRVPNPGTPGEGFGTPDVLSWVEETIPVHPQLVVDLTSIWDALYAAIRLGEPFPIPLQEAVDVMRVVSMAKADTVFA
ncbi:MAG TPA: Gfo/Idh/MocA family oxidoreductase [Armatimonadota bacterium]